MGPRPAEGVRRAPGAEARVLTRQAQAPETLCFQGKLRNLRETLSLCFKKQIIPLTLRINWGPVGLAMQVFSFNSHHVLSVTSQRPQLPWKRGNRPGR